MAIYKVINNGSSMELLIEQPLASNQNSAVFVNDNGFFVGDSSGLVEGVINTINGLVTFFPLLSHDSILAGSFDNLVYSSNTNYVWARLSATDNSSRFITYDISNGVYRACLKLFMDSQQVSLIRFEKAGLSEDRFAALIQNSANEWHICLYLNINAYIGT
jgi:hypothetical protein